MLTRNTSPSNLSYQRAIEVLWKDAHKAIYWNEKRTKEEDTIIAQEMQCINVVYAVAKELFEGKYRNSWERYFEHLREVVNIITKREISDSTSIFEVVVAILHDIIEDTDITPEFLEMLFSTKIEWNRWQDFGGRVALAVKNLSKRDWREYILSPEDRRLVTTVEAKNKSKNLLPIEEEVLFWTEQIPHSALTRFNQIKTRAKELRNHDFYSSMNNLSDEELNVKFADRLHNLRTQWDPNNKKQVEKKIKETKRYFLPLAKERNTKAYHKLQQEVENLEMQLGYSVEIEECIDNTKNWTDIALEK